MLSILYHYEKHDVSKVCPQVGRGDGFAAPDRRTPDTFLQSDCPAAQGDALAGIGSLLSGIGYRIVFAYRVCNNAPRVVASARVLALFLRLPLYMGTALLCALIAFIRNVIGLVTRPYETCRRIVDHGGFGELVYVAILLAVYFAFASLVKVAAFRPFLLTRQFILLAAATGMTYILAVTLFWTAGKLVGSEGKFKGLAVSWGYSLLATLTWFLATSLLYVILPPPRTTSTAGVAFSVLFLIFSATLFFWKATIAYLTLRFGLRLNLGKIFTVFALTLPVLGLYSYCLYRVGIFRIPFL